MPEPRQTNITHGSVSIERIWWILCCLAGILWLPAIFWAGTHNLHMLLRLFPGGPVMDDLFTYHPRIALLGTPSFYTPAEYPPMFAYPPAAAYLLEALYAFGHEARLLVALGLLLLVMSGCALFWLLPRALPRRNRVAYAASIALFAYPLLFALQRGNIEVVIGLLSFLGVMFVYRKQDLPAAVAFGLAATLKPFPLLFLGLFLRRRIQWRTLAVAVGVFLLITFAALYAAGPSIPVAARGFLAGLSNIEKSRAGTDYHGGLTFDHSFFSLGKVMALAAHLPVRLLLDTYYVLAGLLLIGGAWRAAHLEELNRLAFYTVLVVALSPISYEYSLVNCYGLLVVLLASTLGGSSHGHRMAPSQLWALSFLSLILLPFSAYGFAGRGFGGQVDAVLLAGLIALSLYKPWAMAEV